MKKTTLVLTLALASIAPIAQTHQHTHEDISNPNYCGEAIETNRMLAEYPEFSDLFAIEQENFQAEYEDFLESWSPDDRSSYVVPVVVHVVHLNGPENITDEQIYNGIEQLNNDFNMTNDDLGATISEFSGITGNCDIEFRLATKDPDGNCHSGITRTYSETTYDEGNSGSSYHPIVDAVEDAQGNWPQNKYMNIFICIDPNGNAGYTFRPTNWFPSGRMYGSIFLRHDYMGVIGTSSPGRRHTLSHEVGHWLNLKHPWGGSNNPGLASNCSDDDDVADTPNTIGWTSCDIDGETCGSLDNVQNIMDYSYCSTMFSEGQAARVQAALEGGTAQRYKLFTESNLTATGVNGPGELCEANFSSNVRTICAGSTVDFSDLSFHTVTDRTWTFEGGSPSTSDSENPTITYDTPGVYSVTLDVSNGGDSETRTEDNYIVVLSSVGTEIPYHEGFEWLGSVPDNNRIMVDNEAGDETWTLTSDAAHLGDRSVYIDNHGVTNGSRDGLVSGTIDLSEVDPDDDIVFNFKYAYKKRSSGNDEWIRFYISKDCGETWALRKNIHGDDLGESVSGSPYTPGSPDEWVVVNITNIFPDYYVSNFRYKIEFQNDVGNNIYIDDINLYASSMTVGIDESDLNAGINVYPNPLENEATIELNAVSGEDYNITLYNALGEKVTTVFNGQLTDGVNTLQWSTEDLAKGIYVLRVETQGQVRTIKLVKD